MQAEHTYFDSHGRSWTLTAYPALRKVLVQLDGHPYWQGELSQFEDAPFPAWSLAETPVTEIPNNIALEAEALWHEMTGGGHV